MRNIEFKVRMSPAEHAKMVAAAEACGLDYAPYCRYLIFGPSGSDKIPHQDRLSKIAYDLSRISDNINRAMYALHRAEKSGLLSAAEFVEMQTVLEESLPAFSEPRAKFLALLKEFKKDDN